MTATSIDAAVKNTELRMIHGPDHSIGELDENSLQVNACFGNAGRLDAISALVVYAGATYSGDEFFIRWEQGHFSANYLLRKRR